MDVKSLTKLYRDELLDNVVPFWLNKSQDTQFGGYYTCLDRTGNVFDTDKFIWLQGREIWLFSMLYNNLEKKPEWLECAKQGGEFLKKYGHDGNYNWYFSLTREGKPIIDPYNIFSYTFATMAFGCPGFSETEWLAARTALQQAIQSRCQAENSRQPSTSDLLTGLMALI